MLCPPREAHHQQASNSVHLLYIAWMSRKVLLSFMWEQPQSAALWEKEVDDVCTHCQHLHLDHGKHCYSCGSGHWVPLHMLGSCEWNICTQDFICILHGITDTHIATFYVGTWNSVWDLFTCSTSTYPPRHISSHFIIALAFI